MIWALPFDDTHPMSSSLTLNAPPFFANHRSSRTLAWQTGTLYDFSALTTADFTAPVEFGGSTPFQIVARFCGVTEKVKCNPEGAFCLADADAIDAVKLLGTWTNAKGPDSFLKKDDGVVINYDAPTDGLSVYLRCAKTAGKPVAQRVSNDFVLTYDHPAGCPASGGSGGLSGGWIFLIILLVVTVLYIGIGCAVCIKKYEKRGIEACPHKDFWCAIPGLAKDGCAFTVGKIKGCFGGNKGGMSGSAGADAGGYNSYDSA